MNVRSWVWAVVVVCAGAAAGCGDGGTPTPDLGDDEGVMGDAGATCTGSAQCDDGLFCNGAETCVDSVCTPGTPVACDDGIACTQDRCSEDTQACRSDAPDVDGDGHRDASCLDLAGDPLGDDCDDDDINRFPSNLEVCDTEHHDEDCSESTFGFEDRDADTFADARCCNETAAGGMNCGTDCNDVRPEIRPGSTEACDRLDNDCDTMVDEMVALTGFVDADFDGIGGSIPMNSCGGVAGFSTQGGDCDDADPSILPNAPELCDGVNNDCDGGIDETMDTANWYLDGDGDGFGDMTTPPISSCFLQAGRSLRGTDCNDSVAAINPAAAEQCDGLDNNCNGAADFQIGVNDFEDDDDDGVIDLACPIVGVDCDDQDPTTGGGAAEACDGRDNDCDERVDEDADTRQWFRDNDEDGYGSQVSGTILACQPQMGFIAQAGDCNDTNPLRNPGAAEGCNGVDDDCDSATDEAPAQSTCPLSNALGQVCQAGQCRVTQCPGGTFDCNQNASDGCEIAESTTHCGGCNQNCAAPFVANGSCVTGQCQILQCAGGRANCDGDPRNGCEVDISSSNQNCGGCAGMGGSACGGAPGGQTTCIGGTCQVTFCSSNQADCNGMGSDGCEINTESSLEHCGACFRNCETDPGRHLLSGSCNQGSCFRNCETGWGDCNNNPADGCEREIFGGDINNCGGCNVRCIQRANATPPSCGGASCLDACMNPFHDCNGVYQDGCETNTDTNPGHCGGCAGSGGMVCPQGGGGETGICVGGNCTLQCARGRGSCDGMHLNGCETDTDTDRNHCGGCNIFCADGPSGAGACIEGVCGFECNTGFADCNMGSGCETPVGNDILNCGGCGVSCGAGSSCQAGFCDRGLQLAVSNDFACMRRENGALVCWGVNDYFRLGINGVVPPVTPPFAPPFQFQNVGYVDVAIGPNHGCGVTAAGAVSCWGRNNQLQLGNVGGDSAMPTPVTLPVPAVAISVGEFHSCAIGNDAQVYCWGSDANGQLGNSTVSSSSATPLGVQTTLLADLFGAVSIASSELATCVIMDAGDVRCWGTLPAMNYPLAAGLPGASWMDVQELVMGRAFACVRRVAGGGSIYCWGGSTFGEFSSPPGGSTSQPVRVLGVSNPLDLYAGDDLLCARSASGIYCRGRNGSRRLGTSSILTSLDRFEAVTGSGNIVEFADGGSRAGPICGFTAERDVYCWGDNPFGLIAPMGGGTMTVPTRIGNLTRTEP